MLRIAIALFLAFSSLVGCATHKVVNDKLYDPQYDTQQSIPIHQRVTVSLMVFAKDMPAPTAGYVYGAELKFYPLHCEATEALWQYFTCDTVAKRNVDRIKITFETVVTACPEIRVGSLAWAYTDRKFIEPFTKTEHFESLTPSANECVYILR